MFAQHNLRPYNTFGLHATARYFATIGSENELREFLIDNAHQSLPLYVLGGGSNILLTGDVNGIVLKMEIKGVEVLDETETAVRVRVGAGENWHGFVLHSIAQGWGGVENLALIPGTVGAAPMQNIGAYGMEIKSVCVAVEAMDAQTGAIRTFSAEECRFGYRESVFKHELKGKYIITRVHFLLAKAPHALHIGYGDVKNFQPTNIQEVADAVISIRRSKLPDPAEIGNSGSFFKNPVVSAQQFAELQQKYPEIPHFDAPDGVKIPAAWLIERCGWKGKRLGNYGVHDRQALVLVNYGGASGAEILALADAIILSVQQTFGISLEKEVNVW